MALADIKSLQNFDAPFYAVIGHPVAHSLSPFIHESWMTSCNIKSRYSAIDILPADLKSGVRALADKGCRGFNVTVPHKETIIPLCGKLDESARKIGAVNTVSIDENGTLTGFNTDAFGFIRNLQVQHKDFQFADKTALILGAGGATKAIVHGLLQQNIRAIYLANRTKSKAEKLVAEVGEAAVSPIDWERRYDVLADIDLLVNATTLGMEGQPPLCFDLGRLKKGATVYDIIYKPLMTDLLQNAKDKGFHVVTGLGMLLYQAQKAFEIWHGVRPDISDEFMLELENMAQGHKKTGDKA